MTSGGEIRTAIRVQLEHGKVEFEIERIGICDPSEWIAVLFDKQKDAAAFRYSHCTEWSLGDPLKAMLLNSQAQTLTLCDSIPIGSAAVAGQFAFVKSADRIAVCRITDAGVMFPANYDPPDGEVEFLNKWASTAEGRIELAHKSIAAGSVPAAVFWEHSNGR